jgi:ribonuclease D
MTIITDTAALQHYCQSLSTAEFVTVDTEFLRDKYYYPKLCLIQMAAPDADPVAIDPLAPHIDLSPLKDVFQNTKIIKVFHSAKQDIEIILQLFAQVPDPLFDTQVAAMVCGFGEAASYASLVEKIAKTHIDKSSRFTDWSQRPLSEKQVTYALSDVTYLRTIYLALRDMLTQRNRIKWVQEEMQTLLDPATYETNPDEVWQKIRTRTHSKSFLFSVKELAKWREIKAQRLNIPRTHVLKDPLLLQIAASLPGTYEELIKVRGVGRLSEKKIATELLAVIHQIAATPKQDIPSFDKLAERADTSKHKAILDLLRVLLKAKAAEHEVADKLIATADDLALVATGNMQGLACERGWRYDIFGKDAMQLLSGEVGLTVKDKKIVFCQVNGKNASS